MRAGRIALLSILVCLLLSFGTASLAGKRSVTPVVLTVGRFDDPTPQVGDCPISLREAILAANAAGAATIYLPAGTYSLAVPPADLGVPVRNDASTGDLDITGQVTLIGNGTTQTIIQWPTSVPASDRLVHLHAGARLQLAGVSLFNGLSPDDGGAIDCEGGSLKAIGCSFNQCAAAPGFGQGGAIANDGGVVALQDCLFNGNSAHDGGAVADGGQLSVGRCVFTGNAGDPTEGTGGALFTFHSVAVLDACTFAGNAALNGGAIRTDATDDTVTLTNSTFSGNVAATGGAMLTISTVNIANCTFSGNAAAADGGAIVTHTSALTALNSTFTGNSAHTSGGFLCFGGVTPTLGNCIVAGNTAPTNIGIDIRGGIHSLGHNLIGSTVTMTGAVASDLTGVDPKLGPLQDNGGPTFTHALLTAPVVSPAIDAGDNAVAGQSPVLGTDQRGSPRPATVANAVDMGAFELGNSPLIAFPGDPANNVPASGAYNAGDPPQLLDPAGRATALGTGFPGGEVRVVVHEQSGGSAQDVLSLHGAAPGVVTGGSGGSDLQVHLGTSTPDPVTVVEPVLRSLQFAAAPTSNPADYRLVTLEIFLSTDGVNPVSTVVSLGLAVTQRFPLPMAAADRFNVDAVGPTSISAPGLLRNDTISFGGPVQAASVTEATTQGGTVTIHSDGSFLYQPPAAGLLSADTFPYQACVAAGYSQPATVTVQPTFRASGTITANGAGREGVTVTASPGGQAAITAADGTYQIRGLANGSYTLTPSSGILAFSPPNRPITVADAGVTGQDFQVVTYQLGGHVRLNGDGVAGVTVTLQPGNVTATTDGAGQYAFADLLPGDYHLSAAKAGLSFTPAPLAATIMTASVTTADFQVVTHSVHGLVIRDGVGKAGVTLTATPGGRTATTDASGNYVLTGLIDGSYTITPMVAGLAFTPSSTPVTIAGADVTDVDFSGGGKAGKLKVAPTRVNFGVITGSQASAVRTVKLTNTGHVGLLVTVGAITPPFVRLTPASTSFLSPHASRTVSVQLPSGSAGTFQGLLSLTSSDPKRAAVSVKLSAKRR